MEDKELECCICYDNFKTEDNVIQLKCSIFHVYHYTCMEKLIHSPAWNDTCALCREQISLEP